MRRLRVLERSARQALRQGRRRPLHEAPYHSHERHRVRGELVFTPVLPPLLRERPAPRDRFDPPRGTAAAKETQRAETRQRERVGNYDRLRTARRRTHRKSRAEGERSVRQDDTGFRPAGGLRPPVPLFQHAHARHERRRVAACGKAHRDHSGAPHHSGAPLSL